MGIKKFAENFINRWLYSDEIKEHEQQEASGIVPRPQQNGPSEAEMRQEQERMEKVHTEQVELIKAEDHTQTPTEADIKRYFKYHVNMVENISMIKEKTGQSPPWPVPERPLTEAEYNDNVVKDGWKGLRMSCGLPTGDLSKPKKPWTMADADKQWNVNEKDPEIHWKTKE